MFLFHSDPLFRLTALTNRSSFFSCCLLARLFILQTSKICHFLFTATDAKLAYAMIFSWLGLLYNSSFCQL